jgi:hypothetical protein
MVYIFYVHLVYLQSFGKFYGHLVHICTGYLVYFSRFGML